MNKTSEIWQKLFDIQERAIPKLNGLFPSSRWHPWAYKREDKSAYFTASILQGLMGLENVLHQDEKEKLEQLRVNACKGLAPFRNSHGLDRYNFWETKPAGHFPNGYILRHFPNLRPPDDSDDSVMVYLMQRRSREEALWLKNHIDENANGNRKWVSNAPDEYSELRAWCTFFSLNMPLGFDACVIINILYFNRFYGFEINFREQESVKFLSIMLRNKDHIRRAGEIAPYYPETSTILFHLARLLGAFRIEELEPRRRQVERDIENLLLSPLRKTERTMLEVAWLRLTGSRPPGFTGTDKKEAFAFFVLPFTQEYEGGFLRWLAKKRITHIRFGCESHELSLELEKEVLMRNVK